MPTKPLHLTIALFSCLALTGCSGVDAGPAGSSAVDNPALSDDQLRKVVDNLFEGEPGLHILSGERLGAHVDAAGSPGKGVKISTEECYSAQSIDIGAEMEQNNIVVGTMTNPAKPTQSMTLTVMSAGDPAEAQAKFDQGVDTLGDCQQVDVEVMNTTTEMSMKEVDVEADAQSSLGIFTVFTFQDAEAPGTNVMLLDNGLQVQLQTHGFESDPRRHMDPEAAQYLAHMAQNALNDTRST